MCDTIVSVGDQRVLFAKNSDRDANESQILEWFPAQRFIDQVPLRCTWIEIPQVATTHAVMISRPWWMWGAEMGANEHGVIIGNEAVFTKEPLGDPALTGMDLLRLALERSTNASDAVGVIIDLLERHGQGGPCSHERPEFSYHNSFMVADREGAIVLETAGTKWATEIVRSGVRSISNGLTIPGFAERYSRPLRSRVAGCEIRRARTERSAKGPLGPQTMMAALRDHGERGVPRWSRINGTLHAPCVHAGGTFASSQTTASLIGDLSDNPLFWATASAAPCTSIFKPVRVNEPIDFASVPTNHFDANSYWWRHEQLHRRMMRDYEGLCEPWQESRDVLENAWIKDPPSSVQAFAIGDDMERAWLASHTNLHVDKRPAWVRRTWRELDRAAGMPVGEN